MTTTNKTTFDYAVIALLFTFEALCWLVNELLGLHKPVLALAYCEDPLLTIAAEVHAPEVDDVDYELFTVKQLKEIATDMGIAFKSKIRKAELVALLAA